MNWWAVSPSCDLHGWAFNVKLSGPATDIVMSSHFLASYMFVSLCPGLPGAYVLTPHNKPASIWLSLESASTSYVFKSHLSVFIIFKGQVHQDFPLTVTLNIASLSAPTKYNCDFDQNNICTWTQDQTDSFDWTVHRQSTSSLNTGPSFDHTQQNSNGESCWSWSRSKCYTNERWWCF